jgi:hypothetical protein
MPEFQKYCAALEDSDSEIFYLEERDGTSQ